MQFSSDPVVSALMPAASLCQRALSGDDLAAAELLNRLAAGDRRLESYVSLSQDPLAVRIREAIVTYLARGRWQGRTLPLPPAAHAGQLGHRLRESIAQACQAGSASAWERTLLTLLGNPDPLVRETAIHLLECSRTPEVVFALLEALGDSDERVRWAAGIELARHGRAGTEAVLHHLVTHGVTPEARHVMAYVLRHTADEALRQQASAVVEALDSADYRVAAPLAANQVLASLGRSASGQQ